MAKQLQLLHKDGLESRSAATAWVNDTLKKRTGKIGEPIVAVYAESGGKHALLALCLSGTDYQIIDIDGTKTELEEKISQEIGKVKSIEYHYDPSTGVTTAATGYYISGINVDNKRHVTNVTTTKLPDAVDISGKLDVGNSGDAKDAQSYYGLKADIGSKANSSEVYKKSEVDDKIKASVGSVYKVKGSCTHAELQLLSGNVEGDVWNVTDEHENVPAGTNYVWDGSQWDALGGTIDLSTLVPKSEYDDFVNNAATKDYVNNQINSTKSGITETLKNYLHTSGGTIDGKLEIFLDSEDAPLTIGSSLDQSVNIKISSQGIIYDDKGGEASDKPGIGNVSLPFGNIYADKFVTTNGNAAQFVKGDGSLDSYSYALSDHNHDAAYAPKSVVDNALAALSSVTSATTDFVQGKVVKEVDTKVVNLGEQVVELSVTVNKLQETIKSLEAKIENLESTAITDLSTPEDDGDIEITGSGNTRTITLKSVTGGEL